MPRYIPEPLPPAERAAFSGALKTDLHAYDLAAVDRLRAKTGETRGEWARRVVRASLAEEKVAPYAGGVMELSCPRCRAPAVLAIRVYYSPGLPDLGVAPRWRGEYVDYFDAHNPECGCTLSESDTLSASERAVEQWERRLLSGEAHENAGAGG